MRKSKRERVKKTGRQTDRYTHSKGHRETERGDIQGKQTAKSMKIKHMLFDSQS